jgi:hypothetical protein
MSADTAVDPDTASALLLDGNYQLANAGLAEIVVKNVFNCEEIAVAPELQEPAQDAIICLGCLGLIDGEDCLRKFWSAVQPEGSDCFSRAVTVMMHQPGSDHFPSIGGVIDSFCASLGAGTWGDMAIRRSVLRDLSPGVVWVDKFLLALRSCTATTRESARRAATNMLDVHNELYPDVHPTVLIDLGVATNCNHTTILIYARTAMMPIAPVPAVA